MPDDTRANDDGVEILSEDDEILEVTAVDHDTGLPVSEPTHAGAGGPAAGDVPAAAGDAEARRLRGELDHMRDVYLRKLAEFDNFRKRTEREREELHRTAGENLVRELIPVLDNFERALQHAEDADPASFRQGVEMIAKQLWDVLERQGMDRLDPLGQPFQPEFHEAVQRIEDGGKQPGTVAAVLAKGYVFGGRLIRPAMVGVVVEAADAEESQGSAGDGPRGGGSS